MAAILPDTRAEVKPQRGWFWLAVTFGDDLEGIGGKAGMRVSW